MWEKPDSLDYRVRAPSPQDLEKNGFLWFLRLGRPHREKEVFLVSPRGGALIWLGGSLENSLVGAPSSVFERDRRVSHAI